jgi:multicomponent Na+:H+ antiporter subunit D
MWAEVFWKSSSEEDEQAGKPIETWTLRQKWSLIFPVVFLAAISLYIGLAAEHVLQVAMKVASELVDTSHYVRMVLGDYLNSNMEP